MRIFLLTPVYATTTGKDAATPVVHYFAREWVKQGHNVTVFHLDPRYPSLFYLISRHFQKKLISLFNTSVPISEPKDYEIIAEGVKVYGITYTKYIPHSRISKKGKNKIVNKVCEVCKSENIPDIFIGHWEHPQLDILPILKSLFKKPICLVFHSNDFVLEKSFGKDFESLLKDIDIIGFRNISAKKAFERKYWTPQKSIVAFSGVSEEFLEAGRIFNPSFENIINRFIFVGYFLERKYPVEVLKALSLSFGKKQFYLTYVGDGLLKSDIEKEAYKRNLDVIFTGRLTRNQIIRKLEDNQVFVMISKEEIFGLVYLEAMALGLIAIGSKGEGIDGIIEDGINGFLCKPGDYEELAKIINRIQNMPQEELLLISRNARKTALLYSDSNCARIYLEQILKNLN